MNKASIKQWPLCVALAVPLLGCQTTASQITASGGMSSTDGDYVTATYAIAQLDEQAGKLAASKASDPRVKDIASRMSREASVLYPNLRGALLAEHQAVPASVPGDVMEEVRKLSALDGPAFDREFVGTELAAHKRAVEILKREDGTTKDGALRTQVETELPAVQANLDTLTFLASDLAPKQG